MGQRIMETQYILYRWTEEELTFARRLYIRHEIGEQLTRERVRHEIEREVADFKPGLYRAVPVDRMVDFEVKAEVVLS